MGSFNIACGLSHLTIYSGDPLVFVPLEPSWGSQFLESDRYSASYIVSNDGAYSRWQPLTMPIFGTYDDYGRLENVREDSNTVAIENYFGMPINDFLGVFFGEGKPNDKFPAKFAGMFIHGEIYERLSQSLRGEWDEKDNSVAKGAPCSIPVLERLGFQLTEEELADSRYNQKLIWPGNDQFYIGSDGRWITFHAAKKGKEVNEGIYHPEKLAEVCAAFGVNLEIEPLFDVSYGEWIWDDVRHLMVKREADVEEFPKESDAERRWAWKYIYSEKLYRAFESLRLTARDIGSEDDPVMLMMYKSAIVNNDLQLRKQMVAWHNIYIAFHHCNQLLGPSWNGLQCGCDAWSNDLSIEVQRVLAVRLEEQRLAREEDEKWMEEWKAKEAKKKKKKKKSKAKKKATKKKAAKKKTSKKANNNPKIVDAPLPQVSPKGFVFDACTFVENGQDGSAFLNFFPDRQSASDAAQETDQRFENDVQKTKLKLVFTGQRTKDGTPLLGLRTGESAPMEGVSERFAFDACTFVENGQDGSVWLSFFPDRQSALEAAEETDQRFEEDVRTTQLVLTSTEQTEHGLAVLRMVTKA